MSARRMDNWPRAAIAKAVQMVLDGNTYKATLRLIRDGPEGRKLNVVCLRTFWLYVRPLVVEARLARARAIQEAAVSPSAVEVIPPGPRPMSLGQQRAQPVMLDLIATDTQVALPWVNSAYGALYNQAVNLLTKAKRQGDLDDEVRAMEVLRRVLNDMAEAKGLKRMSDQALVTVLLQLPPAALPESLTAALEERLRKEALGRLATDLKGVLCETCVAKLRTLPGTSRA